MKKIVELRKVSKTYTIGEKEFKALDSIDLSINKGELVVVLRAIRSRKIYLIKFNWRNGYSNFRRGNNRWRKYFKIW